MKMLVLILAASLFSQICIAEVAPLEERYLEGIYLFHHLEDPSNDDLGVWNQASIAGEYRLVEVDITNPSIIVGLEDKYDNQGILNERNDFGEKKFIGFSLYFAGANKFYFSMLESHFLENPTYTGLFVTRWVNNIDWMLETILTSKRLNGSLEHDTPILQACRKSESDIVCQMTLSDGSEVIGFSLYKIFN